jgi:catechol 2,3-dioxygenase-like lactoylglutathione lyase family enzyme
MLAEFAPSATIPVKDLGKARPFYEGVLGFEPIGSDMRGAQAFKVAAGTVVVYESQFAGTNQATAVTWTLGDRFDDTVRELGGKGVRFEHYQWPGVTLEGDVHVAKDGAPSRVAWFKDPDGNIHNLNNGH